MSPLSGSSYQIIDVQRGVHKDFELLVIYSDTLSEYSLHYDRVRGECRIELTGGRISSEVVQRSSAMKPGVTITSVTVDPAWRSLILTFKGEVYLREYIVGGPPALMLDISRTDGEYSLLPFELDREDYLKLGGEAERNGNLDLALRYVNRVRKTDPADYQLTHRAGIIEHSLGLWEAALETFTVTKNLSNLAADAHARKAMIYLAQGDTSASGEEWSSYFHKQDTEQSVTRPSKSSTPDGTAKIHRGFPRVVKAGGGSYILFGWGLLALGLLGLGGLLLGSGRRSGAITYPGHKTESDRLGYTSRYSSPPDNRTQTFSSVFERSTPVDRFTPQLEDRIGYINSARTQIERVDSKPKLQQRLSTAAVTRRISSKVAGSYRSTTIDGSGDVNGRRKLVKDRKRSENIRQIPTDLIIEKAKSGTDQMQIARELNLGRDEVSMVINLAKLGRKETGENLN